MFPSVCCFSACLVAAANTVEAAVWVGKNWRGFSGWSEHVAHAPKERPAEGLRGGWSSVNSIPVRAAFHLPVTGKTRDNWLFSQAQWIPLRWTSVCFFFKSQVAWIWLFLDIVNSSLSRIAIAQFSGFLWVRMATIPLCSCARCSADMLRICARTGRLCFRGCDWNSSCPDCHRPIAREWRTKRLPAESSAKRVGSAPA